MSTDTKEKFKDDSSDADMEKILRATNLLNGWRKRMKDEYEAEDWHLGSAIEAFGAMLCSVAMEVDDDDAK